MDPKALLERRLTQSIENEKNFSDKLKERRGLVQSQENTASPIFERLMQNDGSPRVSASTIINPLQDFTTENTRYVQEAESGLERATGSADSLLSTLIDIANQDKIQSRADKELQLKEVELGAVYNPETGRYEMQAGGLNEDQIKSEAELRKEFDTRTKESGFKDVQASYEKIKNTSPTAQGDLSLIFAYMKMLDPSSTVREGEYANAENTAGVDQAVIRQYNKVLNGQKLSDGQRKGFKNEAGIIYNDYVDRQMKLNLYYDTLAKTYGLDNKRVTGGVGRVPKVKVDQTNKNGTLGNSGGVKNDLGKGILDLLGGLVNPSLTPQNSVFSGLFGGNQTRQQSGRFTIESVQ